MSIEKMSIKTKFQAKLLSQRKQRHLTQEQAAERLDISVRWYQKIETGHGKPNLELICKIASLLDIDFAVFYEEAAEEESPLQEVQRQ